jgi:hypothetical protein
MPDATWATLDLAINEDLHLLSTEGNRPSLPSLLRPERPPERKRRETGGGNPTLKPGKKREKVGERMNPVFLCLLLITLFFSISYFLKWTALGR